MSHHSHVIHLTAGRLSTCQISKIKNQNIKHMMGKVRKITFRGLAAVNQVWGCERKRYDEMCTAQAKHLDCLSVISPRLQSFHHHYENSRACSGGTSIEGSRTRVRVRRPWKSLRTRSSVLSGVMHLKVSMVSMVSIGKGLPRSGQMD